MIEVIFTIVIIVVLTLLARINKAWKYLIAFCVLFYLSFSMYIAIDLNNYINNAVKQLKQKEGS